MDRDLFRSRLAEVLQLSPEQFETEGRRLPEDLDSLVVLDILALVDEMFGVALPLDALKGEKTADDILDLIATTSK